MSVDSALHLITANKATAIFVAGTVGSAAVVTMPEPREGSVYYRWAYDFLHQLINAKRVSAPKA